MTTATATIVGPVTDATLTPVASTPLTIRLICGSPTLARFPGGTVVAAWTGRTDATGEPETPVVLPLNSEAEQPGTFYRATCGSTSWSFRLEAADSGATIAWGDVAHSVISPEPPGWVSLQGDPGTPGAPGTDGTDGAPGAVPPSTVASRPPATAVPDGALHFATDLNGGQATVSDGSSWQAAAPSINTAFGGRHLGGAQLVTNYTNVGQAGATDIPGMTVTFTSTGGPVLLVVSALFTQLRRSTWTPVAGTLKAPSLWVVVDGAIVVGCHGSDVDASILPTTGTGRSIGGAVVWPVVGLAATSHTAKLQLPGQGTETTWGASLGFPTFGTPGTRLDVIQLSA